MVTAKARASINAIWKVTLGVEEMKPLQEAITFLDKYLFSIEAIVGERECKLRAKNIEEEE